MRVAPNASGTVAINTLIYDFSGSSFHYNSDYGDPAASFDFLIVQPAQYAVRYHSNVGTDTFYGPLPSDATVPQGDSYTVGWPTEPERTPFGTWRWVGWNTNETGTGTSYAPGDVIEPTGDVDLYAVWVPVAHWALAYNLQGGTGDATTDTITVALATPLPGESVTVTETTPTKTGFTFAGWNTLPNGSGTAYPASGVVPNPEYETLVILYAQWAPNERSVTYLPGTCSVVTGSTYVDTSTLVNDPYTVLSDSNTAFHYTCTGGTFTGWKDADGNSYPPGYVYTGVTPLTLIAQWAPVPTPTYAVTYLGNGNTGGAAPSDTATYVSGETVTVLGQNTLTRTGYTFGGWALNAGGTGTVYSAGDTKTVVASDIVFYAKWTPIAPIINVNTGPADSTTVRAIETHTVGQPISGITVKPVGDGIIDTYTVTCSPDLPAYLLATPTPNSGETATAAEGVSISGTLALFAAVGTYHCVITAHGPGGTSTVDYTLVVQPMRHDLTTAVVGQGSVNIGPGVNTYDSGTVVTLSATPAAGWRFLGWDGDCAEGPNPITLTMTAAKSCTARFEPIPVPYYKLTVSTVGEGTATPGTNWYIDGSKAVAVATPAAGWFFTGWTGACTGTALTCEVLMTMDKAVTATFVKGVTITTKTNGSGTVKSSQPTGTPLLPGTKVTLTATPDEGWEFAGWSGSCSGAENPLTVTLEVSKDCTATFTEKPKPVVEPLAAKNDTFRTAPNTPLRLPAGASILRNDGTTITNVALATKTKHGTIKLAANGKLVYTPNKGFVGVDSFKYKAFDANGRSVIATVKIVIAPKTPTDIKTGR